MLGFKAWFYCLLDVRLGKVTVLLGIDLIISKDENN